MAGPKLHPTVSDSARAMLAEFGYSDIALEELAETGRDEERAKALRWVDGMVSERGRDRGKAVRECGRLFPAVLPDGEVVIISRPCRDRACPRCMVARARELGAMLRAACELRTREHGPELAFVTLTQPKRHASEEGPGEALDRMLKAWARLTRSSSKKRNLGLRRMFTGGVRGVECVFSGRGKPVWSKRGWNQDLATWKEKREVKRVVAFDGWHAHLHCIVELEKGVSMRAFAQSCRNVWAWASPGSNPWRAVDVQALQPKSVGQVAKYVTKPFELEEDRARQLFSAIHSRRMLDGFGVWKSWRKWVPETDNPYAGAVLCAQSLSTIAKRARKYESQGRGSLDPEALAFCEWHHCKERETTVRRIHSTMKPAELHTRLREGAARRNHAARERWAERAEREQDKADRKKARAEARALKSP